MPRCKRRPIPEKPAGFGEQLVPHQAQNHPIL
jgi:hypothetical protein